MKELDFVRAGASFLVTLALSLAGQSVLRHGVVQKLAETGLSASELFRQRLFSLLFSPLVLLGFSLCGLAAVVWLYVLAQYEIGRALPILGGLGYIAIFVVGKLILREQTGWLHFAGVLCVIVGIALLSTTPE
jgi:multidrug transporter EmrE-like cation transporter